MRIWRSSPFVAIVAVTALSMGIGFTTTMFSIVRGATRPLPFADAHELVAVRTIATRGAGDGTRPFEYRAWSAGARAFAALGVYESVSSSLAGDNAEPERVTGAAITANVFEMLDQGPLVGRVLQARDMRAGAPPVVLIGYALWQRRFARDPGVVGTAIRLTGVPHEVIGVMPERFGFPVNAAFWTALPLEAAAWPPGTGPHLQAFGRLADGASMTSARAELEVLTRNAHAVAGNPDRARSTSIEVIPFQDLETPREVIRALYLLVVAVSFVLLIACANVANLLIARAASRSLDAALRLALGATRRRILQEQLAETLSLSAVAMVAGLLFAHGGTRLFAANTSHIIEAFWVDFRIDLLVLLFASALAVVATLAAGIGPALLAARRNVADVLKDGAHGSPGPAIGRFSRGMIAVQVALACGLLALTLVLARTSVGIHAVPWPFDTESILTFEFVLSPENAADVDGRNRRLIELSRAINDTPGVSAAAFVTALPGRGGGSWTVSLDTAPPADAAQTTAVSFVTPEFFTVARARASRGRLLTWRDDASAPRVAVVNESFARRFSPDRDPIGRRVFLGARDYTVVGVVPDLMAGDVQERRQDGVYTPMLQSRPYVIRVMATGQAEPAALMPAIRETFRRVDPDLPLTDIFSLHEAVYRDKRVLDVLSTLFLVFGIGALSLTAIGLYGVVSFGVAQRTREIGIRLALGASRREVLALVVRQGSRQLIAGVVAGTLLALGLSRAFAAAVEQLPGPDAPLLLTIAAAVSLTVFLALIVPARRAAALQIVQALRNG